uniref:Uncharacterized protein n=1 Tax=Vitis vinifera TaxID=29760 RepID=A5CBM5_VITVI|nr:hypothetical protein VITISV_030040 [Vitis vinifera]
MVSARFRRHSRGLRNIFASTSYSRRAAKLASTLMFSASSLRHISGNFRRNSIALYKKAAKFSQQKADFATLWSDLLAMAVTPSFQLRIMHRLKHWILDFLSFEMCSFLAYFERLWQRAMELQSLVLHEFELFIALPWIPNNSPQSWIVLVIKLLTKTPKLTQFDKK